MPLSASTSNVELTPLYGRAPRGERAYPSPPRNTGTTTTLIAALSVAGMGPALLLEGATAAAAFELYAPGWYLPAYSPDLSPIEEAIATLKALLRRTEARTRTALPRSPPPMPRFLHRLRLCPSGSITAPGAVSAG